MAASSGSKPNLWDAALRSLPNEKQTLLRSELGPTRDFKVQALTDVVAQAKDRALSSRKKIKTRSGEIAVRDIIDQMAKWVNKFIAVGDNAVQYDPAHAALPWAAFRFLLQGFVNDINRAAQFSEGLETVAFYIYNCALRETLYLQESHSIQKQLESYIVRLYATILEFMHEAKKYFETNPTRRLGSSFFKTGDELSSLLQRAAQQANDVFNTSGVIDSHMISESHTDIKDISQSQSQSHTWLRKQLQESKKIFEIVVSSHIETRLRFDTIDERAKQDERLKILQWLSSIPYRQHHKKEISEVLENTGLWLLENEKYSSWKNSDETAITWLHGAPGTGKSKLMSLALDRTLTECGHETPALYFYCSRTAAEPERASTEGVLRCLVKELSTGNMDHETDQIPEYVAERYKAAEKIDFASGKLTVAECQTIIARLANDHKQLYFFIDALDEVEEAVQYELMGSLKFIMKEAPNSQFKVLISSRDDTNVASLFSQYKTYDVCLNSGENQNDINNFVETQLACLIEQGRINVIGKPPSPKLQQGIGQSLCTQSQGMFRWVSLQFDYLCTLHKKADITSRLGRLPQKLSESYEEIWARKTHSYEPEDMNRLHLALSLLLVPNTPTPAVFARFVFGEDEDSDEDEDGDEEDDGDGDDDDEEEEIDEDDGVALSRINLGTPQDSEVEQTDHLIEWVTKLCFGLVIFDATTNSFRFAHTSVQEYIVSRKDGYMPLSRNCARIAKRCMSILIEPESVIDSVRPYTNRLRWSKKGDLKHSSTYFPNGDYFEASPSLFTIDWITNLWAYYVAKSYEMRRTRWMRTLETRLQDSVDGTCWESINPSVFFSACKYGNIQLVQKWLSRHPRLAHLKECGGGRGRTALHLAAIENFPDIAACLLKAGADSHSQAEPLKPDAVGDPPIYYAVAIGSLRIVRMLLQCSQVDANGSSKVTTEDHTLSHALDLAMVMRHEEIIYTLIDHAASLSSLSAEEGWTLLQLAFARSLPGVVQHLLDRGASLHHSRVGYLEIALWYDESLRHDECVRLLLDAGANPGAISPESLIAPLGVAILSKQKRVLQMFLDLGVGVNDPVTAEGLTALMLAALNGNEESIDLLLAAGADPNITDVYGASAMIIAAQEGNLKAVKALLPRTTNLNIQGISSETALSEAAFEGHQFVVEALLEAGAEVEPQEPGPHCSFLSPRERIKGFASCASLCALESGNESTFRAILRFSALREPQAGYEDVLHSLEVEGWDSFNYKRFDQDLVQAFDQAHKTHHPTGLFSTSEALALAEPFLHTSLNAFSRFVAMLICKYNSKKIPRTDFVKRNKERAKAIVEERKRKHEEEWLVDGSRGGRSLVTMRKRALGGSHSTTNTFNN